MQSIPYPLLVIVLCYLPGYCAFLFPRPLLCEIESGSGETEETGSTDPYSGRITDLSICGPLIVAENYQSNRFLAHAHSLYASRLARHQKNRIRR